MTQKRMAVLGLDGADPALSRKYMKKGMMPNLAELADQGGFGELETIHASQSPVAWASFFTGQNPGQHGIFDFIVRDPKALMPSLGLVKEIPQEGRMPQYESYLQKRPIWETLSEHSIPSVAAFIPSTFPAKAFDGFLMSGMGIPDIRGSQGTPSIYWTDEGAKEKEDFHHITIQEHIQTTLLGPMEQTLPLHLFPRDGEIGIGIRNEQETFVLKHGEWSEWVSMKFTLPNGENVAATARFKLVKWDGTELKLYLSPVMLDPQDPVLPVGHPPTLSKELLEHAGNFKLVSFESDVYGMKEEWIDEETWLQDMRYTFETRMKAVEYLFKNKKWQFFATDLFAVDRAQHLFWRFMDTKHPLYNSSSDYLDTVEQAYALADERLGRLLKEVDAGTLLFVISDHGFISYRHNLQINNILKELGFLALKDEGVSRFLGDLDWSKTQAYAVGFGSIYLNREGREAQGIVSDADFKSVRENVMQALKRYKFEGHAPFLDAVPRKDIYHGNASEALPDVVPVIAKGYRAARQSILGAAPAGELAVHENDNKWSGDHVGPHPLTDNQGVVFCNQSLDLKDANLMDFAPTALKYFGVGNGKGFDGKTLI